MVNLELFSKIFKRNPLPMIITNVENDKINTVNNSFLEKTGYREDELIGFDVKKLKIFIDYSKLDEIQNSLKNKNKISNEELFIKSKDGKLLDGIFYVEKMSIDGVDFYLTVMTDITEKIELKKNLEIQSKKFENIIQAANLGTWEWDIQADKIIINEELTKMLGYSLEELGELDFKSWSKLVHPKDMEKSRKTLQDHLAGKTDCIDRENRIRHKSGEWVWFRGRGKIVERDKTGKPLKMFGIHTNIDRRKKIEKELQENKKRFLLALDKTRAGLWDINLVKDEAYFSPMWKEILGYEEDEISNSLQSWIDLWHPDEKEINEKTVRDYFENQSEKYNLIHRLRHKDGSWRWILSRSGLLKDEDGNPYRWIGTNMDISEFYASSVEFEKIFSVNLDLLSITNEEGEFLMANKAWEEILGYSLDEIMGHNIIEFVHGDDMASALEVVDKLRKGEKIDSYICKYRNKNGEYKYLEWRLNPHEGLIYSSARDITERIRYEKKILEISNRDALTGAYNRRYVYERAREIIEEYKRDGKLFSVSILDIDDFKLINDKYGHQIGDEVLKKFTRIIENNLRPYDILGRYGGEEFIIILNNSDIEESKTILERILYNVRNKTFTINGNYLRLTFSGGISSSKEIEKDRIIIDELVEIADERMYRAKNSGKDKIIYKNQ